MLLGFFFFLFDFYSLFLSIDQTLLPGLHVRMNLHTGLKEAKLLDGDDGTRYRKTYENLRRTGHTGIGQSLMPSPTVESSDFVADNLKESGTTKKMREDILEALKNIKSEDGKTPEVSVFMLLWS